MTDKDILLMMKDNVVMRINFDCGRYDIINEKLLPFVLQGAIRPPFEDKDSYTKYEMTQIMINSSKNKDAVISWLASRVLPLTRDNAKKIYSLLHLDQRQDEYAKAKIAVLCRAVSLQDNYWLKLEDDNKTWSDINLRENHLNEVIAQVSLHGASLTPQGELTTPELTGQGAYAKAWKRENDELWLYKRGAKDPTESRIEVMVSNILDKCNVKHLHYEIGKSESVTGESVTCCKCKCMTTDEISILPAIDFNTYCIRNGLDFLSECIRIDSDQFYKMCIVDYLISNWDRHRMNWGFFYNCDTNEILGMHPLFDHNNSFDRDFMMNDDSDYQVYSNKTIKEAAVHAMKHTDFHFTDKITREDFITDRQFESFTRRANQLKISTKCKIEKLNI